jgi:hypothetical protein
MSMIASTVACEGCGTTLKPAELSRGLAHSFDRRPFCVRCLPLFVAAPSPTLPVATPWGDFKLPLRRPADR